MTVGSLFSGIGGLDLGLERAGMEIKWQCEIDPFCRKVLAKHWPDVPCYEDVRAIDERVPRVDLICGGFPCQPWSLAGKRNGVGDSRNLWPEMLRVVATLRPRWILGENVPGIVAMEYFERICADLESLDFQVLPIEVPAVAFGAPHIRYRLFVVAHSNKFNGRAQSDGRWKDPTVIEDDGSEERMADTKSDGRFARWPENAKEGSQWRQPDRSRLGVSLADSDRLRELQQGWSITDEWRRPSNGRWWSVEPDVGRVAHGVPSRMDRLRGLGNAVVPQVAEWIGRRIMEAANAKS